MKTKHLSFFVILFVTLITTSCSKPFNPNNLIDDKNKIDIKGTLMNGDMKNPNIEARFDEKTLYVTFYDDLGECIVSVANKQDSVVFCDTVTTGYNIGTRFFMGDQPKGRYRLHITNGVDGAEGWFNNFRIVAVKPKS